MERLSPADPRKRWDNGARGVGVNARGRERKGIPQEKQRRLSKSVDFQRVRVSFPLAFSVAFETSCYTWQNISFRKSRCSKSVARVWQESGWDFKLVRFSTCFSGYWFYIPIIKLYINLNQVREFKENKGKSTVVFHTVLCKIVDLPSRYHQIFLRTSYIKNGIN